MFRVLFTPIIRSVLKLYMQLLVQYNYVLIWCQIRSVERCSGIGSVQLLQMLDYGPMRQLEAPVNLIS